jgi:hypothetical protein
MKINDCFVGQKVGYNSYGLVFTGEIKSLSEYSEGYFATVDFNGVEGESEVDIEYLLGVVE